MEQKALRGTSEPAKDPPSRRSGPAGAPVGVDLYWLPLGAGGHSVRLNGIAYEAVLARRQRRARCDLYHSALEIRVPGGRFVIEMTPVGAGDGAQCDVVASGPVGARWAARFRIFRYEIRRWRDGFISDVAEAVDSPRRVVSKAEGAQQILDLVSSVPTPVWGRDELNTGDMWNSNSVVSWLLARSGVDADSVRPPADGRAPGWQAGLVVARRQMHDPHSQWPREEPPSARPVQFEQP